MMDVLFEVLKFLGYSIIGFLAGYQVCKIRRNTEEIKEAVVTENSSDQDGTSARKGTGGTGGVGGTGGTGTPDGTGGVGGTGGPGGQGGTYSGHAPGSGWQGRALGVFVLILSIFTVTQGVYTTNETRKNSEHDRQVTECQAEYNRDFARAVTVRGQYADQDRNELLKMISTVITETNPALRRKAIEDWVAVTTRNDKLRAQNPLPNLAERNCEGK